MVLMRKLHKWISLLVGLQVLLWLISGLVISLLDPAKVNGAQWRNPTQPAPEAIPPEAVLEPYELPAAHLEGALGISLAVRDSRAVYRIRYDASEVLLDAADGGLITTSEPEALSIARRDFSGAGEPIAITPGVAPERATRNHHGPYWRVDFSDDAHSAIYVSTATGEILERRNDYWRTHDFFWMLHIMDYTQRENFNNPLVIGIALVSVWLGISGAVLLVISLRRRGCRYLSIWPRG
jgi:Na+-transporting NADH:ubiquinone oxidoreductase subunit F